ncbi:cyclic-phosphate processing receiver domain-containing protein [Paenibacillus sp. SYP-B4298]|uniref:cyclic-phosphate processing receiver domain-containing protein n=1 Tax=Paenibacillus sp. SYP-B4298 TaxID=2996034 RepID=UPI0022DD72DF|nr:cyclic-phosphate processing receiver domain-containing protein [Paenibacillus sp. SYP-B4298]
MIHLYLDDYRRCPTGFVLALNAEECILLLDQEEIGILSLDFDLGWGEPTGMEVAKHIVSSGRYPQEIYLHTSSPAGKMKMYQHLSQHAPEGVLLHFGPMADSDEALRGFAQRQGERDIQHGG